MHLMLLKRCLSSYIKISNKLEIVLLIVQNKAEKEAKSYNRDLLDQS